MKSRTGRLLSAMLLFLAFPFAAPRAADEVRVAVVAFDVFLIDKDMGSVVSQLITSRLASRKGIEITERSRLDEVLTEMELSQTGVVAPGQAVATGKMLGANAIVMGSVGKLGVKYVINIRLVETESGKVVKAFSVSGDRQEDFLELSETLAALLAGAIAGAENPEAKTNLAGAAPSAAAAPAYPAVPGAAPAPATQSAAKDPSPPNDSSSQGERQRPVDVSGYWNTEWYDGKGRHGGAMHLQAKAGSVTGWTIEDIGPARISASLAGNALEGEYVAAYGSGSFEFSVAEDGERLIGSYTTGTGLHSTWNAWKRPDPHAQFSARDRVLVDWSGDIWTYPAIAAKRDGDRWFVQYEDGDSEWIDGRRIYAFKILSGEVVQIAQENQKDYRFATALELKADSIQIEYQDGLRKWEPISRLRLLRVRSWGY